MILFSARCNPKQFLDTGLGYFFFFFEEVYNIRLPICISKLSPPPVNVRDVELYENSSSFSTFSGKTQNTIIFKISFVPYVLRIRVYGLFVC